MGRLDAPRLGNLRRWPIEPRDFGAPKDYREIFFFGESGFVLIDSESIAEVIRQ
jgi:hypothetical protein